MEEVYMQSKNFEIYFIRSIENYKIALRSNSKWYCFGDWSSVDKCILAELVAEKWKLIRKWYKAYPETCKIIVSNDCVWCYRYFGNGECRGCPLLGKSGKRCNGEGSAYQSVFRKDTRMAGINYIILTAQNIVKQYKEQ